MVKRTTKDVIPEINKPAIRKLVRRVRAKRINALIYETRIVFRSFLESVVRDAVVYTEHARRKIFTAMVVVNELKSQ